MTADIALVLVILLAALVLFFSEKVRMDIVALLVLVALAFTGLVTPTEAISGFSNAAVITVWAMFILSEGLTETGVAGNYWKTGAEIGRQNRSQNDCGHHAEFRSVVRFHEQYWRWLPSCCRWLFR